MAYKTVLVHLDDSHAATDRLLLATRIAASDGGHLIGAALTGVSRLVYQNAAPDDDPHLALHLGFLRERAGASLAGCASFVAQHGLASFEQRVVDDEAGAGMSLLARYADLVVIGQYDPEQTAPSVMSDFPAYVVMHAGRPVLVVPYLPRAVRKTAPADAGVSGTPGTPGTFGTVLVAWNASNEAARAVASALPLLKRAGRVLLAVFDAETAQAVHGPAPGAELVAYLARHGVHVEVMVRSTGRHGPFRRHGDVGEALLGLADEVAADLLVMGGYGHSRLRETIIGGVTRTVLQHMTLPVLMTH